MAMVHSTSSSEGFGTFFIGVSLFVWKFVVRVPGCVHIISEGFVATTNFSTFLFVFHLPINNLEVNGTCSSPNIDTNVYCSMEIICSKQARKTNLYKMIPHANQ
jgi:hypothetical protein